MATSLEILLKATDKASPAVKALKGALGDLDDTANKSSTSLGKLASVLGAGLKAAAAVGAAAIAGVSGVLAKGIKDAAGMEQGVANIAAIMGKTTKEVEPLKKLITDLGIDPKLKVSAFEAAGAIEMLARNGLNMTQILDGAARSTVLLANATNADFATAADIATDVMQLFNIAAENMNQAVNGITGVTTNSKFSIDDYRLAIAQAGGVAAAMGVEFDDFNAVIAAIAPYFASGSDAGTSFKTFLQRLVPDTEKAKDVMKQLGIITADGTNRFFDSTGAMRGMDEIAGILNESMSGLSEEQKNQMMSTMFGTDAMRAAFGLMNAGQATILEYKKNIGNTSAEEAAATRMDTLSGAWEIFQGIVEALSIQIGDKFLPVARRIVDWASQLGERYGPVLVEWAGKLADALTYAIDHWRELLASLLDVGNPIGFVVNAVREVIRWVGDVVGQWVKWQDVLIAAGVIIAQIAIPAITAFIAAIAPVVGYIAAIVAAVAALRLAWESDFLGIRTALQGAWEYLKTVFGDLGATIKQFGGDALKEIGLWLKGQETDFAATKRIWESAKSAFGRLWEDMKAALKNFMDHAWQQFKETFPQTARFFTDAVAGIRKLWGEDWGGMRTTTDGVLHGITSTMERYWINWKGDWKSTLEYYTTGDVTYKFLNLFRYDIPTMIAKFVFDAKQYIGGWVDWALRTWNDTKNDYIAMTKNWWSGVRQESMHIINTWVADINQKFENWWTLQKQDWGKFKDQVIKIWNDWFGWFKPSEWWESGKNIVQGLWDGFKSRWDTFWEWAQMQWTNFRDGFKRFFGIQSPSTVFAEFGRNIMAGLQGGLQAGSSGVFNAMDALSSGIMSRANALNVSLEGSLTEIAGRITALQNHQTALARLNQVGAAQIAAYNFPPVATGVSQTASTPAATDFSPVIPSADNPQAWNPYAGISGGGSGSGLTAGTGSVEYNITLQASSDPPSDVARILQLMATVTA